MGLVSAKVLALGAAAVIGLGGVAYTGHDLVVDMQNKIQTLEDKAELFHDEAYSKGVYASKMVTAKNSEIDRLAAEIDRLEGQLQQQKDNNQTDVDNAKAQITQANTDMNTIDGNLDSSLDKVGKLADLGGVTDSKYQVQDEKLTIAVVSSQSNRTIKLGNPNTVAVTVHYSGGDVIVPGGDVVYVTNSPSAEVFTYTVPGTGEVVNNTK